MRNFKELEIWHEAMDLAVNAYSFCKYLPNSEKFNLISQIKRSAVSIPTNIAEGCSRTSEKEFKRYIEVVVGSGYEVENLLLLTNRIFIEEKMPSEDILAQLVTLEKRMTRFYQNIRV